MKTTVQCECGSAFSAPASLIGQVVKCPVCGNAMTVPEPAGATRPAPKPPGAPGTGSGSGVRPAGAGRGSGVGARPGAGDTSDGSQAGLSPSGTGSGMRTATGMRPAIDSNKGGLQRDLCPRCKAVITEGGRLCTTCLYELHTGQTVGARGKFKFTLGLGVALALVLMAASAGGFIVYRTFSKPPTLTVADTPSPIAPTLTDSSGTTDSAATPTTASAPEAPKPAARPQEVKPDAIWSAAPVNAASILRAQVQAMWDPATGRQDFKVRVAPSAQAPAGAPALNMGTAMVLYRGESADGPFMQVDAAVPTETDGGGALLFSLFDEQAASAKRNEVYYRVAGQTGDGVRLFDTEPAAFPVLPAPRVEGGRLKWQPVAASGDVPALRFDFVVDAPGWEGVVAGRVSPAEGTGAIDVPAPTAASTRGLPVKVVVQASMPSEVEVTPAGSSAWRTSAVSQVVHRSAASATTAAPQGIVPSWTDGKLGYQLLPGREAFGEVSEAALGDPAAPVGTVLSFNRMGNVTPQVLELPSPPAPQGLLATPFDGSVRLTWDNQALVEGAGRYEGGVSLGVFRAMEHQPMELLATLPLDATTYTDPAAVNGMPYRYEVRVVSAGAAGVAPLMRAEAWVASAGGGNVPVLVSVRPAVASPVVAAEVGLTALHVAIGPAELCYPYTCLPAVEATQAVRDALRQAPGVRVIERDELTRALAGRGAEVGPRGLPAHVQLRVLDAMTAQGKAIELWAVDLVGGATWRLASVSVEGMSPAAFASAAVAMASGRAPTGASRVVPAAPVTQVVFGSLVPMDQAQPYFGGPGLMDDLASAVSKKSPVRVITPRQAASPLSGDVLGVPGAVLVAGRVWSVPGKEREAGVLLQAVDAGTGELVGSFRADEVAADTAGKIADWCAALKVSGMATASASVGAAPSPLLSAEAGAPVLHPVWQTLAAEPANASPGLPPMTGFNGSPLGGASTGPAVSFGLPLPPDLAPFKPAMKRDPTDPLASVRPYVGATGPAMFDVWTAGYAVYVKDDFAAFKSGIEDASIALRAAAPGRTPRLMMRGQEVFTGNVSLTSAGSVSTDPTALVLRGLFPAGPAGQPLVAYRSALEQTFRERPYAAYHAWKSVPTPIAEPFLKAMVLGVEQNQYGRADLDFRLPPDFHQYLAASLLADMNNGVGIAFKKRALETATKTYGELQAHGMVQLTDRQLRYVTNTMLILLFENDPAAVNALANPQVLAQYISVDPAQSADTLRLLVDRVGPGAWEWAQGRSLDWNAFLWQSADEMRLVSDAMPNALPEPLYKQVRSLLGAGAVARTPEPSPASSMIPAPGPINARPMFAR